MIGLRCPLHDQPHPFPYQLEVPIIASMQMPCFLHIAWQIDVSYVFYYHGIPPNPYRQIEHAILMCNIMASTPRIPPTLHWAG
jgi:hypothetical protein